MKNKISLARLLNGLIENGVFLIAAAVLFLKTSETLAYFAPRQVFGYTNVQEWYGIVSALLVEGLFVAVKFSMTPNDNPLTWGYKVFLLTVTAGISAACQVVDGALVRDTLASQPTAIQGLVNVGVPLVPFMVMALVLGKSVFESMPADVLADLAPEKQRAKQAQNGANIGAILKQVFRAQDAQKNYAAETVSPDKRKIHGGNGARQPGERTHKSELTAEDRAQIARSTPRQIVANYGGSIRRAEGWIAAARRGEL